MAKSPYNSASKTAPAPAPVEPITETQADEPAFTAPLVQVDEAPFIESVDTAETLPVTPEAPAQDTDTGEQSATEEYPAVESQAELAPEPVVEAVPETEGVAVIPTRTYSVPVNTLISCLEQYIDDMQPGKTQSIESGSQRQRDLYRLLIAALNMSGTDYVDIMDYICAKFVEHSKGVFGLHVFRFFDNVPLTSMEQQRFRMILHVFTEMADPRTRAIQSQFVDVAVAARTLESQPAQSRMLDYFSRS